MNIRIYCMAHKKFNEPINKIYVPLQVGAALHDDLGYQKDNEGDSISERNPNYSELTGLYWMWKNDNKSEITGLCHYRRYFLNEKGKVLDGDEIERILENADIITTGRLMYDEENVYENYGKKHYTKDLDAIKDIINEKCPEYSEAFDKVMNGKETYFANMFIAAKKVADEYSKWLFDVLFELERTIDMTGYDDYNKRVFGFISERLFTVWVKKNNLRTYECAVGLTESKSETIDAINQSGKILLTGDYEETINYLNLVQENRPDAFYRDSDTDGELALIFTFAQIMAAENKAGSDNLRNISTDYKKLIECYREYQDIIYNNTGKLYDYIENKKLSLYYNLIMIPKVLEEKNDLVNIYNMLANAYLNAGNIDVARVYVMQALALEN